ncbi:hypothetical protein BDAP_002872 [Binucleata daphniae]
MPTKNVLEIYVTPYNKSLKPYTLYEITAITDHPSFKKSYIVAQKRYSQILDFHNTIRKHFYILPDFPKKTLFKCNQDGIECRARMFNVYFRFLSQSLEQDGEWIAILANFLESNN